MQVLRVTFGTPMPIPMFARPVSAGFPSPGDDFIEDEIDLQLLLITNRPATFLFRVADDSMVGKGIHGGDLAVVDRSLTPRDGDVVVVDIDGERSFKVWTDKSGRVSLAFANPRYPAFILDSGALVEVWGLVSGSLNPRRRAVRGYRRPGSGCLRPHRRQRVLLLVREGVRSPAPGVPVIVLSNNDGFCNRAFVVKPYRQSKFQ